MKHMNKKFDHIQDPAGKIPKGEPVFLLRAQDKTAAVTLRMWAELQLLVNPDPDAAAEKYHDARHWAAEMENWPTKKVAD